MGWKTEGKQNFDTWDDKEYCEMLKKRWGPYEDFENDPRQKKIIARQPIIAALKELLVSLPEKPKVLEVGCGCGNWLWVIKDYVKESIGLDPSEHMRCITKNEFAKRKTSVEVIDGTCWKISLKDNEVDVSFQIDVCMHVGGSWESIKEMLRVSSKAILFTGPSFEAWKDKMNYKVRKIADHGMYWGVSYILLEQELAKLSERKAIRSWYYLDREPTDIYKHRILVVEK